MRDLCMSRSGKDPGERLRTAKGAPPVPPRWLTRQINDPYVKKAKAEGWRSRAAYKLIELDEKFGLLAGTCRRAVDLGIAPGGWAQVVRKQLPKAAVVGIDLLPTEPIEGVTIFEMDFMADEAPAALQGAGRAARSGAVGHGGQHRRPQADRPLAHHGPGRGGGRFRHRRRWHRAAPSSPKCFAGGTDAELLTMLKRNFTTVKHAKPPASRKDSSEWYVIAQGFKGRPE
jgi:23S rRNA (uridine2552-2'-O)-methyltransferase